MAAAEIQAIIDDPRPSIPHEEVMAGPALTFTPTRLRSP
ncbi:antitoxin PaaA2 family protein [Brucella sp. 22210]